MQDPSVGVSVCVRRRFGDNAILLGAPNQLLLGGRFYFYLERLTNCPPSPLVSLPPVYEVPQYLLCSQSWVRESGEEVAPCRFSS